MRRFSAAPPKRACGSRTAHAGGVRRRHTGCFLAGPNELRRAAGTPPWRIFVRQLSSPVDLLMLGAAVVSGLLREAADAIAIGAIVVLNAVVGFLQETPSCVSLPRWCRSR